MERFFRSKPFKEQHFLDLYLNYSSVRHFPGRIELINQVPDVLPVMLQGPSGLIGDTLISGVLKHFRPIFTCYRAYIWLNFLREMLTETVKGRQMVGKRKLY